MRRRGRNTRELVALLNNSVAPAIAIVATDAVVCPIMFLKLPPPREPLMPEGRRKGRDGLEVAVRLSCLLSLFCGCDKRAIFYNSVIAEVPEEVVGW